LEKIKYHKYQAVGNSFLLIEHPAQEDLLVSSISKVLHPKFGLGGDGLLILKPSKIASVKMRYLNPDGSEAEICGNALRSIGFHLYLTRGEKGSKVETKVGIKEVYLLKESGGWGWVKVKLGRLDGKIEEYKAAEGYEGYYTKAPGNPHVVLFGKWPQDELFLRLGPEIELDPHFPNRTNVNFVEKVRVDLYRLRAWERGTGETLSCATGAASAFYIGRRKEFMPKRVTFCFKGGQLILSEEDGELTVEGWVQQVSQGFLNLPSKEPEDPVGPFIDLEDVEPRRS
jgi:diaminopimelate epimerase